VTYALFLRSFSSYFHSAEELVEFQNDVADELRRARRDAVPMITRHGWVPSVLHSQVEEYLAVIDRVCTEVAGKGMICMLAYGTLLGAVRAGAFIPHDDDVDLFVVLELTSLQDLPAKLKEVATMLSGDQLKAFVDDAYELIRVGDRTGRGVDLFPLVRLPDGSTFAHHKSMRFAPLATEILPPREVQLYDRKFPGPAQPEAFLEWRYGADWRVEQQFFEMGWVYS
jgi:hypothetical protein